MWPHNFLTCMPLNQMLLGSSACMLTRKQIGHTTVLCWASAFNTTKPNFVTVITKIIYAFSRANNHPKSIQLLLHAYLTFVANNIISQYYVHDFLKEPAVSTRLLSVVWPAWPTTDSCLEEASHEKLMNSIRLMLKHL